MYRNKQTNAVVEHIKDVYGVEPEFLWPERFPAYAVFRHLNNRKWFALTAVVSGKSLGLDDDREVEIVNLKFDRGQTHDFAETSDHIFPAYHMNKNNWITVMLDGTLPDGLVFELVRKSYLLVG